jgi:hypothetical protein
VEDRISGHEDKTVIYMKTKQILKKKQKNA